MCAYWGCGGRGVWLEQVFSFDEKTEQKCLENRVFCVAATLFLLLLTKLKRITSFLRAWNLRKKKNKDKKSGGSLLPYLDEDGNCFFVGTFALWNKNK